MVNLYVKAKNAIESLRDERGQDLIEYALLGALIAVACIAAEKTLATAITTEFGLISSSL
jgi:pilus assembly protein Flp/PilA